MTGSGSGSGAGWRSGSGSGSGAGATTTTAAWSSAGSTANTARSVGRDLVSIGECLVEMSRRADGSWSTSIAGDAFNTLFYAARQGLRTGFVSAVGDDLFTPMVIERMASEEIDITQVVRLPGRRNGLYFIENDPWGERTFHYWRDGSAATDTLAEHDLSRLAEYLAGAGFLLITGVTLAVLRRPELLLQQLSELGDSTRVVFDPNFRGRLWRGIADFRARCREIMPFVDIYLPSRQDILTGWSGRDPGEHLLEAHRSGTTVVVMKDGASGALLVDGGHLRTVPAAPAPHVVDTTGAGDAFNAGLITALLRGASLEAACVRANAVAARTLIVQGAIDPAFSDAMLP